MTTVVLEKPETRPARVPSNGHGARRTRDRAGKQQSLIQAALRLFASKGYEITTTREIAAAAGCAEGLIHRYFNGKEGLLRALVEHKISQEVLDLGHYLRPAAHFEEEFLQLVAWEIERAWETVDFFRVLIPRAIVDSSLAGLLNRAVLSARSKAIATRLRQFPQCLSLPADELEVLVQSVGMLGLVFGFMRPAVLGQDRAVARETALSFAKILIRGIQPSPA